MIKLIQNKYFLIGLAIKLLCGLFLASSFFTSLFIPFVTYFVESGFQNPYDYFLSINNKIAFPYPALMLYILAIPKLCFGWISSHPFFTLFIYRLPLLVADMFIFLVLASWLEKRFTNKLIFLYWFSPVLLYISYIHGQLDVIPIAFLFGSLFLLFKDKKVLSAVLLGLSIATKTNIILVCPFFLFFLLSKNSKVKDVFLFFFTLAITFLAINFAYLTDGAFIEMVFNNQEQEKIINVSFSIHHLSLYIIPFSYLMLVTQGLLIKYYNRDLLLLFLGFTFSILLLFIPPMQGWYFWLIPFLVYFYIKEEGKALVLFVLLQVFYLLYFSVSQHADYLSVFQLVLPSFSQSPVIYDRFIAMGIDSDFIVNVLFLCLQTCLLINCYLLYVRGIQSYRKYKLISSPFLMGIGGNSGAGKTTLANALKQIFLSKNVTVLKGDDMHKWERHDTKWNDITHLNPKANYLYEDIHMLKQLRSGKSIQRRHYDHDGGTFTEKINFRPNKLTICEGLHPFYLVGQRKLYDLKIFIQPMEDLEIYWKTSRDMKQRGYTKEKILKQIEKRKKDVEKYIYRQHQYADILICPKTDDDINYGDKSNQNPSIHYDVLIYNELYVEPLLEELSKLNTLSITHTYEINDKQVISIKGQVPSKRLGEIADAKIPGLEHIGIGSVTWPKDTFGALLLLLTYCVFEVADNDV